MSASPKSQALGSISSRPFYSDLFTESWLTDAPYFSL